MTCSVCIFPMEASLSLGLAMQCPKRDVDEQTYDEWLWNVCAHRNILFLKCVTRYAVNLMAADGLGPIIGHYGDAAQYVHNRTQS